MRVVFYFFFALPLPWFMHPHFLLSFLNCFLSLESNQLNGRLLIIKHSHHIMIRDWERRGEIEMRRKRIWSSPKLDVHLCNCSSSFCLSIIHPSHCLNWISSHFFLLPLFNSNTRFLSPWFGLIYLKGNGFVSKSVSSFSLLHHSGD